MNARGDTTETQVAFESVGRNGVKRVIDALVRCTSTDRADERILTTHTQVFASRDDVTPAFRFVQTIIIDNIKGTPETGCRWDDLFMAVVDETGVYRPPVARVKTPPLKRRRRSFFVFQFSAFDCHEKGESETARWFHPKIRPSFSRTHQDES